jgi:hypothetical protein
MSITIDGSDKPATRASLGLGDAATKNVGSSNGDIPVLDATGLPALNASQLTNLTAANLTGALPAISGAALTNLPGGGGYTKISSGSVSNGNLVVNNVSGNIRIVFANTDGGIAGHGNDYFVRTSTNNGTSFETGGTAYRMTQVITDCFSATQTISSFAGNAIKNRLAGWTFIDISNPMNNSTRTVISTTASTAFSSNNSSNLNVHQLTFGIRDAVEANNAFQITLQGNATGITCDFAVMKLN